MQKETYSYITNISAKSLLTATLIFTASINTCFAQECTSDSQSNMNLCSNKIANETNTELENTYNALMKKITPNGQNKLKTAMESWLKYRKDQCEFNSLGTTNGSIHSSIINYCYTDMTNDYIKTLKMQLNCEEGDLSCGNQ